MKLTFQSHRAHVVVNGKGDMITYLQRLISKDLEANHGFAANVVVGEKGRAWDVEITVRLREK